MVMGQYCCARLPIPYRHEMSIDLPSGRYDKKGLVGQDRHLAVCCETIFTVCTKTERDIRMPYASTATLRVNHRG